MPRVCTVCGHDEAHEINLALIKPGAANRRIAAQYGLSERSVRDHRAKHIPKLLLQASQAIEAANADDLLQRLRIMLVRLEAFLDRAEELRNGPEFRANVAEWRKLIELVAKVSGELNEQPVLNLSIHPEWIELRAVILTALQPFPDARGALLMAMEEADNGRS